MFVVLPLSNLDISVSDGMLFCKREQSSNSYILVVKFSNGRLEEQSLAC